jgi:hypothetical protein
MVYSSPPKIEAKCYPNHSLPFYIEHRTVSQKTKLFKEYEFENNIARKIYFLNEGNDLLLPTYLQYLFFCYCRFCCL